MEVFKTVGALEGVTAIGVGTAASVCFLGRASTIGMAAKAITNNVP